MITATDIQFQYSGGLFNEDPQLSLGGLMSPLAIHSGSLENLFGNIDDTGDFLYENEYRAIYVLNTHTSETLYNIDVWTEDTQTDVWGTDIKLGIPLEVEVQRITIFDADKITGGSFTLKFGDNTLIIEWDGVSGTGDNIEQAIIVLPNLWDTTVTATTSGTSAMYDVTFGGTGRNKLYPTFVILANNLTSTIGVPDILVSVVQQGSPINSIAVDVGSSNNAPVGVIFTGTSAGSPISVGSLGPGRSFFIWIKRIIPSTITEDYMTDSFTLKLSGEGPELALTTLAYLQFVQLTYSQFRNLPY